MCIHLSFHMSGAVSNAARQRQQVVENTTRLISSLQLSRKMVVTGSVALSTSAHAHCGGFIIKIFKIPKRTLPKDSCLALGSWGTKSSQM